MRLARVGVRVDGEWFCSTACVESTAETRLRIPDVAFETAPRPPIRLGALLVHAGSITSAQVKEALQSQGSSGLRIGAELRRLGYVDKDAVLSALADQAGVSYLRTVDPSCVRQAPGGLCRDEIRALGVVPIRTEVREDIPVMVVACAAPVPRTALTALRALTGHKTLVYLVSDEDLEALMAAYAADVPAQSRVRVQWTHDRHEAARRIAEVAAISGDVTLREAHLDPLTWIRVVGKHGVDTMFVTPGGTHEEVPQWLAGTTPH
ncbi:MAG: hypothetical protein HOP16_00275 [Acidobacteria bacterium]|nr:hypothetical protein [Acidobacteriota bacterium]